jgi:tetratricopeptide (TPR) repeat protein
VEYGPTGRAHLNAISTRILSLVLLFLLLCAGALSLNTFYGRYYFMLSQRGSQTPAQHEFRLHEAVKFDPTYGYASQALARMLIREGKYGASLDYQLQGMKTFRTIRSFEQLGSIYENLNRYGDAHAMFQSAVEMNPREIPALEHLTLIALHQKNSRDVAEYTREILKYDINNLNAYYFRARDAELHNNLPAAYANYQRIAAALSSSRELQKDAIFTPAEIGNRLKELKPAVAAAE